MKTANDYRAQSDTAQLQAAIDHRENGVVIIPARKSDVEPERDWWLLDSALLLPADTTVILVNCKLKLSDACRDNFFRSANCVPGDGDLETLHNIHIRGEGLCILEGADHPRATGDGSKIIKNPCPKLPEDVLRLADWVPEERRSLDKLDFWDLHAYSYGTDAGKEGESQYGDWRGIGILLCCVEDFSIQNIRIREAHGWAISLENCCRGHLANIDFDARMSKVFDGLLSNMENQDGIDLRNGCHHITITDVTGGTGDDVIALTAIANTTAPRHGNGAMRTTHFMHNDWSRRDPTIHDIIIRNVRACCASGVCWVVRLLPVETQIWNVIIDNVVDTAPEGVTSNGILLGTGDGEYGRNLPGSMRNIIISNVISKRWAIKVEGYLEDSAITNIVSPDPALPVIEVRRKGGMKNVATSNLVTNCACVIHERNK